MNVWWLWAGIALGGLIFHGGYALIAHKPFKGHEWFLSCYWTAIAYLAAMWAGYL
jgi:hypothetical protein